MGLTLSAGVPQVQPTCVTATKDMPILPHHASHAKTTWASYGIAIAMAAQWTPFLNERRRVNPIHVSNLKPYYTKTDLVPVEMDEYLIDSLLDRRGLGN